MKNHINKDDFMKEQKPFISDIQRFCLHDGPGIRTVVFLKGCSLRCPWCSNPECLFPYPQKYRKDKVVGTYGKKLTCVDIYKEILKDKKFYGEYYKSDQIITSIEQLEKISGGVTFSGGEALLQADKLEPLFIALRASNIHTAVETSLFAPEMQLSLALKYIDLFYVDMKIVDTNMCRDILLGDLSLYMRNLNTVFCSDVPVIIRIPVIGGFTDGEENRKNICNILEMYRPIKVELIKEHNFGKIKYLSLGMKIPIYRGVSDELMEIYKKEIETLGIDVQICKI